MPRKSKVSRHINEVLENAASLGEFARLVRTKIRASTVIVTDERSQLYSVTNDLDLLDRYTGEIVGIVTQRITKENYEFLKNITGKIGEIADVIFKFSASIDSYNTFQMNTNAKINIVEDCSNIYFFANELRISWELLAIDEGMTNPAASRRSPRDKATLTISKIIEKVPSNPISPVEFAFVNDVLVVSDQKITTPNVSHQTIDNVRLALLIQGAILLDRLRHSNCDRTLVYLTEALQLKLENPREIIQLGVINSSCAGLGEILNEELPVTLAAIFVEHTKAIAKYLMQFSEWREYRAAEDTLSLGKNDVDKIVDASEQIASLLSKQTGAVDPAVPKSILFLRSLIKSPGGTLLKVAIALLRTIENLIAKVFKYLHDIVAETAKNTATGLSKNMSRLVVIGVVSAVATLGVSLTDITSKFSDMSWVGSTSNAVNKYLQTFKIE